MKNLIYRLSAILLLALVSSAFAAAPAMEITVSSAAGKLAYKGKTNANGVFATGSLEPGNYVVQFNAKDAAGVKGNQFAVVVSSGKRKVTAESVEGEKFAAGGVAMKVEVGPAAKITGQVANIQAAAAAKSDPNVKIINGKRHVWVGPEIGSQMPGRWVEEGSPEAASALNTGRMSKDRVRDLQSKGPPTLPGG